MPHNERTPEPLSGGDRGSGIVEAGEHDGPENTTTIPGNSTGFAAGWVGRRFCLSPRRAALVASMAGIGINVAPVLPGLIGGVR